MSIHSPARFVYLWPLALLAIAGAGVYFALMIMLADALSLEGEFVSLMPPTYGGPSTLFALVAGILGWASVAMIQRRVSTAGPMVWLYAAVVWGAAAAIGFGLTALVLADDGDMVIAAAGCCAGISAVIAGLYTWILGR